MTGFIQLLVSGIAQGCIYALLAVAYNITFSASKTVNFALGSLLMLGGVAGYVLYMDPNSGEPVGRSFATAMSGVFLVELVIGTLLYYLIIRPLMKRGADYATVLATLAFAGIVTNLTERRWSTDLHKFVSPVGDSPWRIGEIGIFPQEVVVIGASIFIVVCLEFFFRYSPYGKVILATSEDQETVRLMGINPSKVVWVSFMISAALAGISGILVAPITMVSASMGAIIGIKGYAVAIIGGASSGYGSIAAGILLGLAEILTARYISTGYKDMAGFVFLILIVLLRPNGLFGGRKVVKL